MPDKICIFDLLPNSELPEKWLDARRQCFARAMAGKAQPLDEHDLQPRLRRGDRRRTARRTSADDGKIGFQDLMQWASVFGSLIA